QKDTVTNAQSGGSFVWNMAVYDQRDAVNLSAQDVEHGVDEFELAGLSKLPSKLVRPPRVAGSPVHFECEFMQKLTFPGGTDITTVDVVFGRVIAIHIEDSALTADGKIDIPRLKPLARMGY